MRWTRVSDDPLTTERETQVENAQGEKGWAQVHWERTHVRLGVVRDRTGNLLDGEPEYVSSYEALVAPVA